MIRILAALALLVTLTTPASALDTGADVGTVKVAKGAATIQRGDTSLAAEEGTGVREGDTLLTGTDGALGVTLNDGTLISIGPNSRFELAGFEFAPQRNRFSLFGKILEGTLVYQSGRIGKIAPEKTRIGTPLSVVAVRGTRFAVRVPSGAGE